MVNSDSETPLVSVLMGVRNGARFLPEAIESILNQTFTNFEFIIVDNGSSDNTPHILRRYQESDPRIVVIEEARPGHAIALNTGLAVSTAPWIARMDADDIAAPNRISRQLEVLGANRDVVALGSYGWIIGEQGNVVAHSRVGPTDREEFERLRLAGELVYLLNPSVIFSRDAGLAVGGYRQDYAPAEDVEFWSRIADQHLVLALDEPLVSYRIHTNSISTRSFDLQMANLRRARMNMVRRRSGEPELTLEQFKDLERHDPLNTRILRGLRTRSQAYYRHGGSLLAARRPRGILWLLASAAHYPPLPFQRLRMQRVFGTIRPIARGAEAEDRT